MAEHSATRSTEAGLFTLDWYRMLGSNARHAFWASFLGWALDAFDYMVFSFALGAIAATFGLNKGQSGLIATVTLVVSAFGGMLAGMLADMIGRVRTLMITVAVYSLFTFLSGLAQLRATLALPRAPGAWLRWRVGSRGYPDGRDRQSRAPRSGARSGAERVGGWLGTCGNCLHRRL